MIILENALLTGIFLIFNLISALLFFLSYLRKDYTRAFYAMLVQTIIALFYFFISYIKGTVFILSGPHDFTANLIYFLSILSALSNAVFAMKMFYNHRVIASIFIQVGIFFAIILCITQLSDSGYNYWLEKNASKTIKEKSGFNQTQDFKQEKAGSSSDSTNK